MLLASCMSQTTLFQTMNTTILTSLHQSTTKYELLKHVNSLTFQPRTLQSIARYKLYLSMGRVVPERRVRSLPLPTSLKKRISQICQRLSSFFYTGIVFFCTGFCCKLLISILFLVRLNILCCVYRMYAATLVKREFINIMVIELICVY